MNKYITAVCVFSAALSTWIHPAQAQDAEATPPTVVEAFYCNMNEGKSMKDLMQVAGRFSKWADKNSPDLSAWVLTPQFGLGADLPDLIWLSSNDNGSNLGKGQDAWQASGAELQAAFSGVVDCSMGHVMASSVEVSVTGGPPGNGLVMFTQCDIDEGSNATKAIAAHKTFSAAMRSMGSKGSSWIFFPMLGGGDIDYDYLGVSTFRSWADFGAAYDMYVTGGGWEKAMETYAGVVSCNETTPTVWDVKLVREGQQ